MGWQQSVRENESIFIARAAFDPVDAADYGFDLLVMSKGDQVFDPRDGMEDDAAWKWVQSFVTRRKGYVPRHFLTSQTVPLEQAELEHADTIPVSRAAEESEWV